MSTSVSFTLKLPYYRTPGNEYVHISGRVYRWYSYNQYPTDVVVSDDGTTPSLVYQKIFGDLYPTVEDIIGNTYPYANDNNGVDVVQAPIVDYQGIPCVYFPRTSTAANGAIYLPNVLTDFTMTSQLVNNVRIYSISQKTFDNKTLYSNDPTNVRGTAPNGFLTVDTGTVTCTTTTTTTGKRIEATVTQDAYRGITSYNFFTIPILTQNANTGVWSKTTGYINAYPSFTPYT